jgi:GT2 family glycosyltransferase
MSSETLAIPENRASWPTSSGSWPSATESSLRTPTISRHFPSSTEDAAPAEGVTPGHSVPQEGGRKPQEGVSDNGPGSTPEEGLDSTPLIVVPTFAKRASDIDLIRTTLRTLRETAGGVDVLLVDDASPTRWQRKVSRLAGQYGAELYTQVENGGFSKAVNVGLAYARDAGRPAVLANSDLEFTDPGWLEAMLATPGIEDPTRPASLVGALLTYPNGLVQHAGVGLSLLTRSFYHRGQGGSPATLELQQPRGCVVTAALCLIRHEALVEVGLYDEEFGLGFEDVDYAIRILRSGRESIYNPKVRAVHHESAFRGRRSARVDALHHKSLVRLGTKWEGESFRDLIEPLGWSAP